MIRTIVQVFITCSTNIVPKSTPHPFLVTYTVSMQKYQGDMYALFASQVKSCTDGCMALLALNARFSHGSCSPPHLSSTGLLLE